MNIVLIGYRGTGKSVVGEILSEQMNRPLYTLDALIVERAGMSIPEIVRDFGWERFRNMETEIARECAKKDNGILDTGGGCILREENVEALKKNGVLYWLQATPQTIMRRIEGDDQRPSLTENKSFVDEIEDVLSERIPLYQKAADRVIDTEKHDPEEVARLIMEDFRGRKG
jgi:shikimate kinase